MAPADAAWLRMDRPTNHMVINAVLWFDTPLDAAALQDAWLRRVVARFPRMSRRVRPGGLGRAAAWVDDEAFEPSRHFHHLALPAPGDRAALEAVVSDLASGPLDRTRPLWDVFLLDGYGDGCAVLVRLHHAVADGVALARVLLAMTDEADGAVPGGFSQPRGGGPVAGVTTPARMALAAGRAVTREAAATVRDPGRLSGAAASAARDARALAKFVLPGTDTRTALRGRLAVEHRVAWSDPVALATIKRIGRAHGATVNDVLVAAVTGALRTHLLAGGEEPAAVHALVPFNLRPLDAPLPVDLGNRFGLLLLELPVGLARPVDRLEGVKARMDAIKRSHEGALAYGILGAMGLLPSAVEARLVDFFSAKGSMVLTNVPGPREPVHLAGAPVGGVLVWAPCSGSVGTSVSLFSYAGRVTVGFLTDVARVPDPQPLADAFGAEVRRLARASTHPRKQKAAAARR
jgi:WS/DGAT/MGAT family acyltransferase